MAVRLGVTHNGHVLLDPPQTPRVVKVKASKHTFHTVSGSECLAFIHVYKFL